MISPAITSWLVIVIAALYLPLASSLAAWNGMLSTSSLLVASRRSLIFVGGQSRRHRLEPGSDRHTRSRHRSVATLLHQNSNSNDGDKTDDAERIRQTKYKQLMDSTTLSLAPMMEYTDRHCRHMVRLLSSKTLLYTEMVAANSLAHERRSVVQDYASKNPAADTPETTANYNDQYLRRYLQQGVVAPLEGPSVLQLGGSEPQQMFEAAETVMDLTARGHCDYTAINLNCGCPSPKVAGKGCFGAALMDEPALVSELTRALHDGTGGRMPITVKCRIGTDSALAFQQKTYAEMDPEQEYQKLCRFIETVGSNGIVTDFSIHARIAVLQKSFSPADNRKIPPLKYDIVRRLVNDYPDFTFSLNGGVDSIPQVQAEMEASPGLKGVMIGRAWVADPWSFAMADQLLYNTGDSSDSISGSPNPAKNRLTVLEAYGRHADSEEEMWDPVKIRRFIVKAVSPLFTGEHNAKRYRVALDEIAGLPKRLAAQGKSLEGMPPLSEMIMNCALTHLSEETLLRTPEESYERLLWAEDKRGSSGGRSESVVAWQSTRKEEERNATAAADKRPICDGTDFSNIRASV